MAWHLSEHHVFFSAPLLIFFFFHIVPFCPVRLRPPKGNSKTRLRYIQVESWALPQGFKQRSVKSSAKERIRHMIFPSKSKCLSVTSNPKWDIQVWSALGQYSNGLFFAEEPLKSTCGLLGDNLHPTRQFYACELRTVFLQLWRETGCGSNFQTLKKTASQALAIWNPTIFLADLEYPANGTYFGWTTDSLPRGTT